MRRALILAGLLASAGVAGAANAQEVTAGGSIEARLGFGDNPYLRLGSLGTSGLAGGTLTGWLRRRTETSATSLTGVASVDQNFSHYGRPENYLASIEHQQTFSAKLSGSAQLRYQDSINPRDFTDLGGTNVDLLSIGQRSRTIAGSGTLQWTPTSRDSFYIGPQYSHTTYPSVALNNFDQYGVRGGYLRQINSKLRVGADLSYQKVDSRNIADSESYQGGLRLEYDFNAIWRFDGSVSLIRQRSDIGGSATTPGFTARFCGKYPRYRICVDGSRQSAGSGFGGLRTDNRVGVSVDYELSSRSRVNLTGVYDISQSSGVLSLPTQKFWEVSGGYARTISDRLSAGFSGRYQNRDYGSLVGTGSSSVTGYSATFDVVYKFGRLE
ncbi:hypothetical protein [Sphingomonas sp.]|uniref:hypothetical protein n=1 Tax=Sphingomonas sp. TaxID=28214 RepID=UPI000DB0B45B|nr:hypothetical protein [Sphingomonas sp.]PZU06237.1 MAG: hypothetical protein DI605_19645 [Sphingomonas sp.]